MKNPFKKEPDREVIIRHGRPYVRKIPTFEEKRKDWAHSSIVKIVKENPELEKWYAASLLGIQLPEIFNLDPVQRARQAALADMLINDPEFRKRIKDEELNKANTKTTEEEINSAISTAALMAIKSNPEMLAQAVSKKVSALISPGNGRSRTGELIEQLEEVEQLRDMLGGGNNIQKPGFFTPELVGTVMQNLPTILSMLNNKDVPQNGSKKVFVVQTPDGIKEMDIESYKKYLEVTQNPQLGGGKTQETITKVEDKPKEKKVRLGIDRWLNFIDSEPQMFVDDLNARIVGEGFTVEEKNQASFVLAFLQSQGTPEKLFDFLQGFKAQNSEWKTIIETLENHPDWVKGVLDLICVKKEVK